MEAGLRETSWEGTSARDRLAAGRTYLGPLYQCYVSGICKEGQEHIRFHVDYTPCSWHRSLPGDGI